MLRISLILICLIIGLFLVNSWAAEIMSEAEVKEFVKEMQNSYTSKEKELAFITKHYAEDLKLDIKGTVVTPENQKMELKTQTAKKDLIQALSIEGLYLSRSAEFKKVDFVQDGKYANIFMYETMNSSPATGVNINMKQNCIYQVSKSKGQLWIRNISCNQISASTITLPAQ